MSEVLFYHLVRQPLEAVLPTLVERSLARGWRCVVHAPGEERIAALDDLLWTYSEESFLPHAPDREPGAAHEPVVLTTGEGNPNGAQVRFLLDGAKPPPDAQAYERLVVMFDGSDDEAVVAARVLWKDIRGAGHVASYWQQNDDGRWEKKA